MNPASPHPIPNTHRVARLNFPNEVPPEPSAVILARMSKAKDKAHSSEAVNVSKKRNLV